MSFVWGYKIYVYRETWMNIIVHHLSKEYSYYQYATIDRLSALKRNNSLPGKMERHMHNLDPYVSRPTEFIDQVNSEGWRIKVYGISANALPLAKEIVSQGTQLAVSHLPQPALTEQRYGVGFLIIHQGTMRNWFLLDWWENEDIIHHILFSSPLDKPGSITMEPDKSLIACVHELRIISLESDAWITTVLCKDDEPSFDRYLNTVFNSREKLHD